MNPQCNILLVDDSPEDILLFRRALTAVGALVNVIDMPTATEASVYLKQEWPHEDARRPDLIVSDSVVDHESGIDFLEWVRVHPRFRNIPFVILSGNTNPALAERAFELGVTALFNKPTDFTELVQIVPRIIAICLG